MLRIRDIGVDPDPDRIRGSMPLTDPAIFVIDLQDTNKNNFKKLLFECTFASFLKIKSHKIVGMKGFSYYPAIFVIDLQDTNKK